MSKLKKKNPKTKVVYLKKPLKVMFRKPLGGGFVFIDDPSYEVDDLLGCY